MRTTMLLPILVMMSACGGSGDGAAVDEVPVVAASAPTRSVSSDLPEGVKPSASVMQMRKTAGVWRSAPGAVEGLPGQSLQLELAFDSTFSMTLWDKDPKGGGEAVFARQSGRFAETRDGIAGSASDARPSGIRRLASWSLRPDKDGTMILTPPGGRGVVLRRTSN